MKIPNFVVPLQLAAVMAGLLAHGHAARAADYVWSGPVFGASTDWSSANNWKATSNSRTVKEFNFEAADLDSTSFMNRVSGVPGPDDTATITSGAVVAIDKPITVSVLKVQDGGILQGNGNITVTSALALRDAQLQGEGHLTVAEGATTTISSQPEGMFNSNVVDKVIDNRGTIKWTSGKLVLKKNFYNRGNFNVSGNSALQGSGLIKPSFFNEGTLTKTDASNETAFAVPFNNSGDVYVQSGQLNVGPRYVQTDGSLNLDGGDVSSSGTLKIQGGLLAGSGNINCDVVNNALFEPGHSPGIMNIFGNYTQTSNGTLGMEMGGNLPGTGYDQLNVYGIASVDGKLDIIRYNNFMPADGDNFTVIYSWYLNNSFKEITGLYIGGKLYYRTAELNSSFTIWVDTDITPPLLTITSPVNNKLYLGVNLVKGTVTDTPDGSGVKSLAIRFFRHNNYPATSGYWLGGSNWSTSASLANELPVKISPNWTFALPPLPTGKYQVRAIAKDLVGNILKTENVMFDINPSGSGYAVLPGAPNSRPRLALSFLTAMEQLVN